MSSGTCSACSRSIDVAAKICPYCGADPNTGERVVDTQAILQEVFHPREVSTSESVLEFARQRQGIVIAVSLVVGFLALAGIHQFVTVRNAGVATDSPAVPLTEIADVAHQKSEATPVNMPDLDFPYDGKPQTMRTFILERGAVAPTPAVATTTQVPAGSPQAPPGTARPAPAPVTPPRPQ